MEKFTKAKFLAWKTMGEKTLIIDSRVGKCVHKLNEVGSLLWNHLEKNSEVDLCKILMNEYEVDELQASQDVSEFIQTLRKLSLLHE